MGNIRTPEVDELMRTEIPPINVDLPSVNGTYKFIPHIIWTESSKDGITIDSVEGVVDISFDKKEEKCDYFEQSIGFHFQERKVFATKIKEDHLISALKEAIQWLKNKRSEYAIRTARE